LAKRDTAGLTTRAVLDDPLLTAASVVAHREAGELVVPDEPDMPELAACDIAVKMRSDRSGLAPRRFGGGQRGDQMAS